MFQVRRLADETLSWAECYSNYSVVTEGKATAATGAKTKGTNVTAASASLGPSDVPVAAPAYKRWLHLALEHQRLP